MSLKLSKCKFAQRGCEWLGHKITSTGITPLVRKTEPIEALTPPRTLTHFKSFIGSTHSLHNYLPALAESSAPLRPLLNRSNEYIWASESQNAFENRKKNKCPTLLNCNILISTRIFGLCATQVITGSVLCLNN